MPTAETSPPYRLFGLELSPSTGKVRSYLRFKGLAHTFVPHSIVRHPLLVLRAEVPLAAQLLSPSGERLDDSTPILEELERRHPEPAASPKDRGLGFLSTLVEAYADDWLAKAVFLARWTNAPDCESASRRIAEEVFRAPSWLLTALARRVEAHMRSRLPCIGAEPSNAPVLEGSLERLLRRLDVHLAHRPYLLGARPCLGDFGLFGQLHQLRSDPSGSARMHESAPRVVAYVERMRHPRVEGAFETWEALSPTLAPLVHDEVTSTFLPWALANATAVAERAKTVTLELRGSRFEQEPERAAAESLARLRAKLDSVATDRSVLTILSRTDGMSLFEAELPRH